MRGHPNFFAFDRYGLRTGLIRCGGQRHFFGTKVEYAMVNHRSYPSDRHLPLNKGGIDEKVVLVAGGRGMGFCHGGRPGAGRRTAAATAGISSGCGLNDGGAKTRSVIEPHNLLETDFNACWVASGGPSSTITTKEDSMKKEFQSLVVVLCVLLIGAAQAFAGPPRPIPEPGTLMLLGAGIAGIVGSKMINKRKK
jgi:hypothetical protein